MDRDLCDRVCDSPEYLVASSQSAGSGPKELRKVVPDTFCLASQSAVPAGLVVGRSPVVAWCGSGSRQGAEMREQSRAGAQEPGHSALLPRLPAPSLPVIR